jgi:O-antigen/teichoic acid export membrane protein
MLTYSTPLVFSSIAVWVSLYIDRMMINHFLGIDDVGIYGIGHRIASIVGLVMIGVQGALTPLIFSNYKNPNTPAQLEQIFRIFLLFAMLMFLFLTLFASDILVIMTTPSFYPASTVVIFLVPTILLSNMYIFAPGISIAKKTHLIVWINIAGGLLNVGLNYILIPSLGIEGAGLATMLSYLMTFSAYTAIGQRFYRIPHNWQKIFAAVALAGILATFVPSLSQTDSIRWGLNLAVLILFIPALFVIGLIRRDEISAAWQYVQLRLSSMRA